MKIFAPLKYLIDAILGTPPAKELVYRKYNYIRQHYIEQAVSGHFNKRADDPTPLYEKTILDVGCGVSTISSFLVLSGGDVTAIDTCPDTINAASQQAEDYGAPIQFLQATAEDFLHNHKKFDVILCLDVIEYIDNIGKFLWTLKQLLAPKGVIIFSTISRTPKAWLLHIFLSSYVYGRTPVGSRVFKHFYTPEHMQKELVKQGMRINNVQSLNYNKRKESWELSTKPGTRYLAIATRDE